MSAPTANTTLVDSNKQENDTKFSHKVSETSTYRSWRNMKSRCLNPNVASYASYGGANPPVLICDRWLQSFENFLADLGVRPSGTTLGRFGDVGNYELSNCKWMTLAEQVENRRPRRKQGQRDVLGRLLPTIEKSAYLSTKGRSKKLGVKFSFDSFEHFLKELGLRPSPKHRLTRYPDTGGDFEAGNVRWMSSWEEPRKGQHEKAGVANLVKTPCAFCKEPFAKPTTNTKKRFCSTLCRVNASREPQRAKHRRWDAARNTHRHMEFDGRITGALKKVGALANFETGGAA